LASTRVNSAAESLYVAIESLRDLALGTRRPDDTQYQDDLNLIATNLGLEGEIILNENANNLGVYFFPKYLNNTYDDYVTNVDDPGAVKSHGQ
jgi:hypothetical protein